jgi:GTP-binding protein
MEKHLDILIIGAPNVGKSTLFNRLLGQRKAVVSKVPGVTRDLIHGSFKLENRRVTIIDSGGLLPDVPDPIPQAVQKKIHHVMKSCSLILFMVDVRKGVTPLDSEIAIFLKKSGQRVLLCINKVDVFSLMEEIAPFFSLGFDDFIAISAEHGLGINDLHEMIQHEIFPMGQVVDDEEPLHEIKAIIMGKQNVGKSSLLNALTRSDRMIVTEIPGTTVDSVDTLLERGERKYRLIDTAGIRKRKRARGDVEKIGVLKAEQNMQKADIALLVLDSQEGLSSQDISIAGSIIRSYKPILLVFNKWDLIDDKKGRSKRYRQELSEKFSFLKDSPTIFVSSLKRTNLHAIFPSIDALYEKYSKKISTSELNRFLLKIAKQRDSFSSSTTSFPFRYMTQVGIRPQRFLVFAKNAKRIRRSLKKFLENNIKSVFGLQEIPIRLSFRESQRVFLKRKGK